MYLNASSTRAAQNALTLYAADIYGHEGGNINSVQISPTKFNNVCSQYVKTVEQN